MIDAKEKEIWEKIKYLSGELAGLTSEKNKDTYKDAMDVWYISMKYVDPDLEDESDDDDEDNDDED
jgi:hypothetical protein